MSDFVFVTKKTESSGKNQRITTNSGKEQHIQRARKNGGKTRVCTFGTKIETTASSRQKKLLLPAILINSRPQFIEIVVTNN